MVCDMSNFLLNEYEWMNEWIQEHRMEVDSKNKQTFTRSQCTDSLSEHKSALTDHAIQENHVIDWAKATVIDREPGRPTTWI